MSRDAGDLGRHRKTSTDVSNVGRHREDRKLSGHFLNRRGSFFVKINLRRRTRRFRSVFQMITCSAPGKIFLFGEHAVVYGKTAMACAIDLRARVSLEPAEHMHVRSDGDDASGINPKKHPYIAAVLELMRKRTEMENLCIDIDSDIPVGSGLGSSAALVIALIKALDTYFNCGMTDEEIAATGHAAETAVQGRASPTDTFVSTFGGIVKIPDRTRSDFPETSVVIGNTRRFSSTRRLVSNVAELKDTYPVIIDPIMETISSISKTGEKYVSEGNFKAVGELMNINQGLLDSIGVGSAELSALVYASRKAGAFGSKITGAGGGGCMIAFCEYKNIPRVSHAIKRAGGDAFVCRTTNEGVRIEKNTGRTKEEKRPGENGSGKAKDEKAGTRPGYPKAGTGGAKAGHAKNSTREIKTGHAKTEPGKTKSKTPSAKDGAESAKTASVKDGAEKTKTVSVKNGAEKAKTVPAKGRTSESGKAGGKNGAGKPKIVSVKSMAAGAKKAYLKTGNGKSKNRNAGRAEQKTGTPERENKI